jgi:hypothetical protein
MQDVRKVLLVEHRPFYKAIYGLNLNLYLGVEVIVVCTIKEIVDYVEKDDAELIFVDNGGYSKDMASGVYKALDGAGKSLPMYVVGKTSLSEESFHIFDEKVSLKYVLQTIANSLKVTAQEMAALVTEEYFPLPMDFIVPGWFCSTPLFVKEGDSYNEAMPVDSVITQDLLDSFEYEGINQLFVLSGQRLKFVNSLTFQITSKLNDPNLTVEDAIKVTATAHQMVMEQARKLGVSDSTLELANNCIDSMNKLIADIPMLDKLLNRLLESNSTFMYQHSFLTAFIGSHIIKKMRWSSKEQQDQYSFICFFNDVSLPRDEYARFRTDDDVLNSDIPEKDKKIILNHAMLSAKVISKFSKFPYGVDTLIKQHHGSKKGQGFNKLYMNISPLAIVYILAQEWADIVLDSFDKQTKPDKKKIIEMLSKKYSIAPFQKVIPTLHTLDF